MRTASDLLHTYVTSMRESAVAASVLASAHQEAAWVSAPTEKLRIDLLRSLEDLETCLAKMGDSLEPPPLDNLENRVHRFREDVEAWSHDEDVPGELAANAFRMNMVLMQNMFAPPGSRPSRHRVDRPSGLDRLGLPLPRAGLQLFFNPVSITLLCLVTPKRAGDSYDGKRLFIRGVQEARYEEVKMAEGVAAEEIAVCTAEAVAYVHAMRWNDRGGGDDAGLFRVALPVGTMARVDVTESEGWISRVHGVSADGSTLWTSVGGLTSCADDGCEANYRLASFDVATGRFTEIAALPGTFA